MLLRIADRFLDSGANFTMGKLFTSFPLAKQLSDRKTTMIGAIRSNQPDIPQLFSSDDEAERRGMHSSVFAFSDEVSLVSYTTVMKRNVLLISTAHATDETVGNAKTPLMVHDYNENTKKSKSLETLLHLCTADQYMVVGSFLQYN